MTPARPLPTLSLDEAVALVPEALKAKLSERLRGTFREVQYYEPRKEEAAEQVEPTLEESEEIEPDAD
jgi:hypothetical protein